MAVPRIDTGPGLDEPPDDLVVTADARQVQGRLPVLVFGVQAVVTGFQQFVDHDVISLLGRPMQEVGAAVEATLGRWGLAPKHGP